MCAAARRGAVLTTQNTEVSTIQRFLTLLILRLAPNTLSMAINPMGWNVDLDNG